MKPWKPWQRFGALLAIFWSLIALIVGVMHGVVWVADEFGRGWAAISVVGMFATILAAAIAWGSEE